MHSGGLKEEGSTGGHLSVLLLSLTQSKPRLGDAKQAETGILGDKAEEVHKPLSILICVLMD